MAPRNIEISSKLKDAVKVGPFGGRGGTSRDMESSHHPKNLTKIEIWSSKDARGGVIKGIRFTCVDINGRTHSHGVWGAATGLHHTIDVETGEYVNGIVGTVGTDSTGAVFVSSLKVTTNNDTEYGPYGDPANGDRFSVTKARVAAFFVRTNDDRLNAVGFYVLPLN